MQNGQYLINWLFATMERGLFSLWFTRKFYSPLGTHVTVPVLVASVPVSSRTKFTSANM